MDTLTVDKGEALGNTGASAVSVGGYKVKTENELIIEALLVCCSILTVSLGSILFVILGGF